MENSIPIPQGKPGMEWNGMEWNGMEWNLEYSMVEPTSKNEVEGNENRVAVRTYWFAERMIACSLGQSVRPKVQGGRCRSVRTCVHMCVPVWKKSEKKI